MNEGEIGFKGGEVNVKCKRTVEEETTGCEGVHRPQAGNEGNGRERKGMEDITNQPM